MSKNKKLYDEKQKEVFNTKLTFIKYAKRYGIILLVSFPVIMILNYILNTSFPSWYKGAVSFFASLALLLLALLVGMIIFNKIDDRRKAEQDEEKTRDPFAD